MRFNLIVLLFVALSGGCGGTSPNDMKRYAIQRDLEEDTDTAAGPVATAVAPDEDQPDAADSSASSKTVRNTGGKAPDAAASSVTATIGSPAATVNAADSTARTSSLAPALQTVTERRQRTIDNLTRIGTALQEFHQQKGYYPPAAISVARQPLLSWRVALLPYLGHADLHRKFQLDEAWNSEHNLKLLAEIPVVYQSPERQDERTNYLGSANGNMAFDPFHGRTPSDFEDGISNTVMVLEVDDKLAVPWTEPRDYDLPADQLGIGLGNLREDGFFVLWGGGVVSRIAADAPRHKLLQMMTIDSGDAFRYTELHNEPTAEPIIAAMQAEDDRPMFTSASPETKNSESSSPASARSPASTEDRSPGQLQPPSEAEQQGALANLRDLYQQRYKEAKSVEQRRLLAQELLQRADQLMDDPNQRFVLLQVALKIAAEAGDVRTSLEAAARMGREFAVRELDLRAESIRVAAASGAAEPTLLLEAACRALADAIAADQYDLGRKLYEIARQQDRKLNQRGDATDVRNPRLGVLKRRLEAGERGFRATARALEIIQELPADGPANRAIGEYYCLIKEQWERGLPLLAKGDDPQLAQLALQELAAPSRMEDFVALADGWWKFGESHSQFKRACQLRAAYWYHATVQHGRDGFAAITAEVRLHEAEERYGKEAVDQAIGVERS